MSSSISLSASKSASKTRPSSVLNVSLWIVQFLLAGVFTMTGFMKIATPIAVLAQKMAWVANAPALVRFIGICEIAGAIGLILPSAFQVRPRLTAYAATGLFAIMLLAIPFHLYRGEAKVIAVPILLGLMAAFVAWGRFRGAPIEARVEIV
jgi:putative oxidoreductase